jgi:DNA-binding NarL/FixJ family response regulator
MRKKIKVILVDDQILFAESLKNILEMRTDDIKVIAIAHNGNELIDTLPSFQPDMILMDIRMPGMTGVEAARVIKEKYPEIKIMMLTTFDDDAYVHEALKFGAIGYLLKTIPPDELIEAIRAIKSGLVQMSPSIAKKLIEQNIKPGSLEMEDLSREPLWIKYLSSREKDIIRLLLDGFSNREIGVKLFIAEQTVKNHLTTIYSKLNVRSRSQAIKEAKEYFG